MPKLQEKHILVTGGAGFIGSNLIARLLEDNNHITCLDNFSTGKKENLKPFSDHPNFTLIEGDIRDLDTCRNAVKGISIVYHQAALGSVPRSIKSPEITTDVNISGFVNMLTAAKDEGVKRFVYAASSSTYGDNTELPKQEDKIGKPLSPYAITKYVNEMYADVFHRLYGIDCIGLRYFNVFGKRQDPNGAYAAVIPKFIAMFLQQKSPVINGDGEQSRDFTYIENVIQANLLAASTDKPEALNKVYNVACGNCISLNHLTKVIQKQLSAFDPRVAEISVKHGPERQGDIKHSLASIDKAISLLDYQPEYQVENGLKEAIEWYYKTLRQDD